MNMPIVSVIIPAYNNAEFLGDAIQSVLTQTYPHFELIIVNDASTDRTDRVLRRLHDSRIRYIVHSENRGLSAARNTGMRASRGELIALLDADDWFHPEKLEGHVKFLQAHPEIGATYNARFELNHSLKTIRELWKPPVAITLADLITGFPFSPSDLMVRREWVLRVKGWNEKYTFVGEDLDFNCRLALARCQFGSIERALNYRRYHSGRSVKNLEASMQALMQVLNTVLSDPHCPPEVGALKDKALSNHYLLWSLIAFIQEETALGRKFFLEATQRAPSILQDNFVHLVQTMITWSILDENKNHPEVLRRMFAQLPPEASGASSQYKWAVGRGYLLKGTRSVFWSRPDDAERNFAYAAQHQAKSDDAYLGQVTQQLLNYEAEFGVQATRNILRALAQHLLRLGEGRGARQLNATYSINRAFRNYKLGAYTAVPGMIMDAISNDPRFLANRGVLAILLRSLKNTFGLEPIRA